MEKLTKEQKKLVKEIMERESPQRRVDEIVRNTKKAMKICRHASIQNQVDKIVKKELKKIEKEKKKNSKKTS